VSALSPIRGALIEALAKFVSAAPKIRGVTRIAFVSGTTGFDYKSMVISEDVQVQAEQCLKNIESALLQAGSCMADIVRVTYIVPDASNFPKCWPALRKVFGEIRPAATMISAGLADPRMHIEIEVTALKPTSKDL
jgi:enamine deaminase RidA (YjgF/YER057c/UK114 family)